MSALNRANVELLTTGGRESVRFRDLVDTMSQDIGGFKGSAEFPR